MHSQYRKTVTAKNGALVQLVRIRACHARGQGFESPTHRKQGCKSSSYEIYTLFYIPKSSNYIIFLECNLESGYVDLYNLEMIAASSFRVGSMESEAFRKWRLYRPQQKMIVMQVDADDRQRVS